MPNARCTTAKLPGTSAPRPGRVQAGPSPGRPEPSRLPALELDRHRPRGAVGPKRDAAAAVVAHDPGHMALEGVHRDDVTHGLLVRVPIECALEGLVAISVEQIQATESQLDETPAPDRHGPPG